MPDPDRHNLKRECLSGKCIKSVSMLGTCLRVVPLLFSDEQETALRMTTDTKAKAEPSRTVSPY
jgi:hypothetical protein